VPIERFLGENTTWTSEVCLLDADGRCDASQCLRGDCNGNGELDAGDPICTIRCLLGQPPPGIDCTCVSDCNCVSGIEAGDPVCSVHRLIGSFSETACGRVP
jgi:hypothetical protein